MQRHAIIRQLQSRRFRLSVSAPVHRHLAAFAIGVIALAVGGCGSKPTYEFDELDLTPTQDELTEFSLGSYRIPIPVVAPYGDNGYMTRNRIELSFDLHALVARDFEPEMADMWSRHEGKIRDRIIRVCRRASIEELQDPEMATLKSHLMDAVQAQLGPKSVRRLLLTELDQVEI